VGAIIEAGGRMSAATFVLDDWLSDYNRALEQVQTKSARLVAPVRNRVWLTKELWSIYRDLRNIIHDQKRLEEVAPDAEIGLGGSTLPP